MRKGVKSMAQEENDMRTDHGETLVNIRIELATLSATLGAKIDQLTEATKEVRLTSDIAKEAHTEAMRAHKRIDVNDASQIWMKRMLITAVVTGAMSMIVGAVGLVIAIIIKGDAT
jgi:hypothetical protein